MTAVDLADAEWIIARLLNGWPRCSHVQCPGCENCSNYRQATRVLNYLLDQHKRRFA